MIDSTSTCVARLPEVLGSRNRRLVLVGPDALSDDEHTRLDAAGVVRLGSRPSQSVPSYLHHADVLVVPHLVTPVTESLDPIKAYEYAAAGRPVVSTPVAGFRELPEVTIAAAAYFPAVVEKMLTSQASDTPAGKDIPTWEQRADQFEQVLKTVRDKT